MTELIFDLLITATGLICASNEKQNSIESHLNKRMQNYSDMTGHVDFYLFVCSFVL